MKRRRSQGTSGNDFALFYAIAACIVMHAAIAIFSGSHPNYLDPVVVIGGFMSHFCFTVPLALVVKQRLSPATQVSGHLSGA
jgi:hypothetical protein